MLYCPNLPHLWYRQKNHFLHWNTYAIHPSRNNISWQIHSSFGCCCSVADSCLSLFNLMGFSTPGPLVLHHLLEFAKVHVHWISDAMQLSHPLSHSSISVLNLSQNKGLFHESLFSSGGQSIGALAYFPKCRVKLCSGSCFWGTLTFIKVPEEEK